eukprot:15463112-Alexandrium_andersonii.AAC.1
MRPLTDSQTLPLATRLAHPEAPNLCHIHSPTARRHHRFRTCPQTERLPLTPGCLIWRCRLARDLRLDSL